MPARNINALNILAVAFAEPDRATVAPLHRASQLAVRWTAAFGPRRTTSMRRGKSAADPNLTWRTRLLDHLVGAGQDRWGDGETKRLGGLPVECHSENGRL